MFGEGRKEVVGVGCSSALRWFLIKGFGRCPGPDHSPLRFGVCVISRDSGLIGVFSGLDDARSRSFTSAGVDWRQSRN